MAGIFLLMLFLNMTKPELPVRGPNLTAPRPGQHLGPDTPWPDGKDPLVGPGGL